MKEYEISQLENFYNCLVDYQTKLDMLNKSRNELEVFSQTDPLMDFDCIQIEQYLIEKAGTEPKKAFFNIGKKKVEYESAMQQWRSKVNEAKKSYYVDKKDERDSIKNNYETELKTKKLTVEKLSEEWKEVDDKLKKSDLNLGKDFYELTATEQLLNILRSRRADSIKEALNIYYLEERLGGIEKTLEMQEGEIQSTKSLANDAIAKAKEAFDLAREAYDMAEIAESKADDAERMASDVSNN